MQKSKGLMNRQRSASPMAKKQTLSTGNPPTGYPEHDRFPGPVFDVEMVSMS